MLNGEVEAQAGLDALNETPKPIPAAERADWGRGRRILPASLKSR